MVDVWRLFSGLGTSTIPSKGEHVGSVKGSILTSHFMQPSGEVNFTSVWKLSSRLECGPCLEA